MPHQLVDVGGRKMNIYCGVYAYRYPLEVKDLVLVEPQHEDETSRLDKAGKGMIKKVYAMVAEHGRYCLAAATKGIKAGSGHRRHA